jgi:hypothetical protein
MLIGGAAVALPTCVAAAEDDDTWRYRLTPYLWIATLSGDMAAVLDVPAEGPGLGFTWS